MSGDRHVGAVSGHSEWRAHAPQSSTHAAETRSPQCDPDVQQVRAAGGPIDRAAYACACGYLFSAPVSTTVNCPHCGCGQAWSDRTAAVAATAIGDLGRPERGRVPGRWRDSALADGLCPQIPSSERLGRYRLRGR